MNFFMRKSFQNSNSSKDHYLLPDEHQKDNPSQNLSDEQPQNNQPHETLIIKNFTDNAKISIDIVYDDAIEVHKTKSTIPRHFINQKTQHQSSPSRKLVFEDRANSRLGFLIGDSTHPPTPIKTPNYNYRQNYDKIAENIQKPIHRSSNLRGQKIFFQSKQNSLNDEIKNQRYFNTQVLFPYPSILKTAQTDPQTQRNLINFDKERTPFPEKGLQNSKKNILLEKRREISQRLKNQSLFMEPKQKSFYKVPQFNLNESINQKEQNQQNHAQNDKPFKIIAQFEVEKEQRRQNVSDQRLFFVREQISDDFLQDKNEQSRKRDNFLSQVNSYGCTESEIAQEVQHDNSFFDNVKPKGEIEDLIIPSHNMEKGKNEQNQKPDASLQFKGPMIRQQKQSKQKEYIKKQENRKNYDVLMNEYGEKQQIPANNSINTDQQSQYLSESHPELNLVNALQIQNKHYFHTQKSDIRPQFHSQRQQEHVTFEKHNIHPWIDQQYIHTQSKIDQQYQTNILVEKEPQYQKQEAIKQFLVSAGKWNNQRSLQILDVRKYSTQPKTAEALQVDNHEQSIAYPVDQTEKKSIQNHGIQAFQDEEPQKNIILNKQNSQLSHINKSQDSINQLSQIQNQTPREEFDQSQIKQQPQNYQKRPLEEEFEQKYDVTQKINLTNKKSVLSLKLESVISYNISPSPKNIKFSQPLKKTFKKERQLQQLSIRSSDKISLTSSIQNSQSRSRSRDSPKTYQELQKYKRLFKKQNKTKNPSIQLLNQAQRSTEKSTSKYSDIHKLQGYIQRSSMTKKQEFIKVQQKNSKGILRNQQFIKVQQDNSKEYQVNDTPKSRQKIKNYFTEENSFDQKQDQKPRFSHPRNRELHKQDSQSKLQRNEWIKAKAVKISLQDKKAQDLFTKHKDQILYKLKRKEKQDQSTVQYQSTSKSNQKPIYSKLIFPDSNLTSPNPINYQSNRSRPLSPYIQNLTNRLSSPNTKQYVCEHYKKHSRRDLRTKFQQLLQKEDHIMLRKYYFSQEEANQIFIQEILGKEINQIYWVEMLKNYGEKKLETIRLKAKANFHPFEKTIVRDQQLLADARRTYGFDDNIRTQSN